MKSIYFLIVIIFFTACTITRKGTGYRKNRDYTPAESELLGALIGAGIGIGLGSVLDTGIDEKWQNYGNATYSSRWNDKSIGKRGRKGGYSASSGYNNVSRYTTKNHKGNNMIGMALQMSQVGAYYGRQIGIENQIRKLQQDNEQLKKQINK